MAYVPSLRPLSTAEVLDTAFSLYRHNFARLISIAAVVYVPLGLVQAILVGVFFGTIMAPQAPFPQMTGSDALGLVGGGLVLGALWLVGYSLVYAALAVAISRRYLGSDIQIADAYNQVFQHIGPLVITWIIVTLATVVGTMLCVIPGIYLAVSLAFAWPLVILEGLAPRAAISRSQELVSGYWWRVFSTMLLLGVIVMVIQMAVMFPLSLLLNLVLGQSAVTQGVNQFFSSLIGMALLPLTMTGLIVLYYDLRVRKEAFDLELMADQIGTTLGIPGVPATASIIVPPTKPPMQGVDEEGYFGAETSPAPGEEEQAAELPPPPDQENAAEEAGMPEEALPAAPAPLETEATTEPTEEKPTASGDEDKDLY